MCSHQEVHKFLELCPQLVTLVNSIEKSSPCNKIMVSVLYRWPKPMAPDQIGYIYPWHGVVLVDHWKKHNKAKLFQKTLRFSQDYINLIIDSLCYFDSKSNSPINVEGILVRIFWPSDDLSLHVSWLPNYSKKLTFLSLFLLTVHAPL